jgi:hypothetical protein
VVILGWGRGFGNCWIGSWGDLSSENKEEKGTMKCPGQDSQYWKPGAIFETKCPKCGAEVEFF